MDQTHFLASQNLNHPRSEIAQQAQIDEFYEEHGYEAFAFVACLRRNPRDAAFFAQKTSRLISGFAMRRRKV